MTRRLHATVLVPLAAAALASLDGRVLDRTTGQPLAGVRVTVGGRAFTTRADGRFRFGGLRPGAAALGVESADVPPARTPLALRAGPNHDDVRACSTTLDYSCAKPEVPDAGGGAG